MVTTVPAFCCPALSLATCSPIACVCDLDVAAPRCAVSCSCAAYYVALSARAPRANTVDVSESGMENLRWKGFRMASMGSAVQCGRRLCLLFRLRVWLLCRSHKISNLDTMMLLTTSSLVVVQP
ncbi:hypothetical protein EXIGLDRAFT_257418 [Exidia glandulosa HHB12029]|uniref:Secreted protein n=1 Tax=Exidia glandulosa HHB12029 TaxID=1314781 RepID=A0A165DUN5_EXIGL|nr:hypothetical protein EXIGLDRAFT_257418 [Exidia glandulosa HHB12029]